MQLGPRFTLYVRDTAVITGLCVLFAPNVRIFRHPVLSAHMRALTVYTYYSSVSFYN